MSQPNDSTSQDILEIVRATLIQERVLVALAALPIYEYIITVDQEVELVWKQKTKFSLASILLVSTRLCMIASAVLAVTPSQSTCRGLEAMAVIQFIVDAAGFVQTALFSALRVSALYERNATLFAVILVLGLVPAGTNILFNAARVTFIQEPGVCITSYHITDALARKLVFITRVPVIVADLLVLVLTWAKTYGQILLSRRAGASSPLSTCLGRDGTLYFLALLSMNVLQLATHKTHFGAPVAIVLATLPPILISRFMLNLRQVSKPTNTSNAGNSVLSTVRFQLSEQAVGSMGAPLGHGGSAVFDMDEEEGRPQDDEVDSHDSQNVEERGSFDGLAIGTSTAVSG